MHQTIHQWKEQKREEFEKKFPLTHDSDGFPDFHFKIEDIAEFFFSQLPSLLTLLEEQVKYEKPPKREELRGTYGEQKDWLKILEGVNYERARIKTLLSEAKQSFT